MKIPQRVLDQIDYGKTEMISNQYLPQGNMEALGSDAGSGWLGSRSVVLIQYSKFVFHAWIAIHNRLPPVTELHYGMGEQR